MADLTAHESERQRVQKVGQVYRDKGYDVLIEPQGDQLPDFLQAFRPDLIAHKDNEHIVVGVRSGQVLFLVEIIRGRWFQSAASASCQSVSSFKSFCSASLSLGKLRKPLILRRRGSMSNSAVANQRER